MCLEKWMWFYGYISFEYLKNMEKSIVATKGESYCQSKRIMTLNKYAQSQI